jgi:AraC-like DNA-binding protein
MGNSVLEELARRSPVMKTVSLPRGRHRLHAMPTSTGYEVRTNSSYSWDGRKRGQTPFTVLQHTVAGAGNLLYERRPYRLLPGDTMLTIIPHSHRYWVEDGGRWEFFWISITGQEAVRIHRLILAATGPVLRLRPETVERLAKLSLRLIDGEGEAPGAASAIAYEAATTLYDDVFRQHGGRAEDDVSLMQPVLDYVRANLDKPLAVADLADIAGLSRAHFSRVFAASEGLPPAEFVLAERMRRAARLLAGQAGHPVKEIAGMCGFEDPNYFAKVFRRFFGTNPTEFRTTGMYAAVENARPGRGRPAALVGSEPRS